MKIEVNISKKYFFSILAVILLSFGVFFVYAFNTLNDFPSDPAIFGHTTNEISGNIPADRIMVTLSDGSNKSVQDMLAAGLGQAGFSHFVNFNYTAGIGNSGAVLYSSNDGSYNWIAPSGVNKVLIEIVGGGAGAACSNYWISAGKGQVGREACAYYAGGNGGTGKGIYDVVPGQSYVVKVGNGSATWKIGGNSSFGGFVYATGGTIPYNLAYGGYGNNGLSGTSNASINPFSSIPGGLGEIYGVRPSQSGRVIVYW